MANTQSSALVSKVQVEKDKLAFQKEKMAQHASLSRNKLVCEQHKQMRDEVLKDMHDENDPDVKKVLKEDFLDANRLWKEAIAVLTSSSSS